MGDQNVLVIKIYYIIVIKSSQTAVWLYEKVVEKFRILGRGQYSPSDGGILKEAGVVRPLHHQLINLTGLTQLVKGWGCLGGQRPPKHPQLTLKRVTSI